MNWFIPRPVRRLTVKQTERMMDEFSRKRKDEAAMKALFYEDGAAPEGDVNFYACDAWKEKVAKDLGVKWHLVGLKHFSEWDEKGFKKAKKGEYQDFDEAERDRLMRLLEGASLRKD
ncbi:hypothetical protein MMC17_002733 [Xylographa soralifera]|nr:hypothetical protein [Xylographa soralifera]